MSCGPYFEVEVRECAEDLFIDAYLLANTAYRTEITDKFNNKYFSNVTSDAQGAITIDLSEYPEGLFTRFAGTFTLRIFNSAKQQVTFTLCGKAYDGFSISFVDELFIPPAYGTFAFIGSVCDGISSDTPDSNYFRKEFSPGAADYILLASEHGLHAQIFSVELFMLNGSTWQHTSFTYDIEPATNKVTLHVSDTTADYTVILTGLA